MPYRSQADYEADLARNAAPTDVPYPNVPSPAGVWQRARNFFTPRALPSFRGAENARNEWARNNYTQLARVLSDQRRAVVHGASQAASQAASGASQVASGARRFLSNFPTPAESRRRREEGMREASERVGGLAYRPVRHMSPEELEADREQRQSRSLAMEQGRMEEARARAAALPPEPPRAVAPPAPAAPVPVPRRPLGAAERRMQQSPLVNMMSTQIQEALSRPGISPEERAYLEGLLAQVRQTYGQGGG